MIHRLPTFLLIGILGWASAAAATGTAPNATEEEKRAAQKMFEAGDGLYESGRYEDAITAFRNSHNLVASPNSRLMLARSLREVGRSQEACEEFRGTIEDAEASGGRYPEALQAARSELSALETQLRQSQSGAPHPSGKPQNEANSTSPTQAPAPATPNAAKTSVAPVVETRSSNPMRTAAWVAAGVGVAGLGVFGAFAYLDRKTFDDLESECRQSQCPSSTMDKVDTGRRYQLIANVGLGVAVVGAAAATTLFVLSPRNPESPRLALRAAPGGLFIDGKF